jgi:2-amino-4-hydroxy-6-hydroxymethyldihydropteridine diphosphokinase
VRWGPRQADLDILLYDDLILDTPDLIIPHLGLRERRFVLEPLAQIAPDARDPVTGRTVCELLARLDENA